MKRLLTLCAFFVLAITVMAQAPQKFTYQAVVRNNSNQLMKNATVTVRVGILQGSDSRQVVYEEVHNTVTNANGLVTLLIYRQALSPTNSTPGSCVTVAYGKPFIFCAMRAALRSTYFLLGLQFRKARTKRGRIANVPFTITES